MNKLHLSIALLFTPLIINCQIALTGKIIDAKTEEPLIGVSVFVKHTAKGTVTDIDGNYVLLLDKEDGSLAKVEYTYTGYESQNLEIYNSENRGDQVRDIWLWPDILQLESIVVSANKKIQDSQSVPMSITSLSPFHLRKLGAKEFRDFASGIPNLSFDTQGAGLYGRFDNGITIRGIAGKNTTALYLDETPLLENLDPRLIDVGRVEILKGPQGTLYGSRNMGGAVKVVTNKPNVNQVEGVFNMNFAKVKEGNFDYGINGILNIPITKKLAFRGTGFYDFETGIFDRKINTNANILNMNVDALEVFTPEENKSFSIQTDGCPTCDLTDKENMDNKTNYGFHASLGFYPEENISIVSKVISQRLTGDGFDFAEGSVGNFTQNRISGVPESFEDFWTHYSLTANVDLDFGKIISSTSFMNRSILELDDDGESYSRGFDVYDGTESLDFFAGNISKMVDLTQFNQEIRFQSQLSGNFNFTFGGFYMYSKENEEWYSGNSGAGSYISLFVYEDLEFAEAVEEEQSAFYEFGGIYESKEFAVFGEAYFKITEDLSATVGLRYFDATLGLDTYETGFLVDTEYFEVIGSVGDGGFIPKLSLTHQVNKDKIVYFVFSKGYRLGDLNEIVPDVFCGEDLADLPDGKHPRIFEHDFLWSYEVGFKGTWADGKLITNTSLFYNDWRNLQQTRTLDCGYSYVSNVGAAHTMGWELEVRGKLFKYFELGGGVGLLEPEIDFGGPNLDARRGDRIVFTPKITANGSLQFSKELNTKISFYLRGDIQHVGDRLNTFAPEVEENGHLIFDAYTLINGRIGIQFPKYEFSVFGNNLTNTAANFGNIFSVAVDIPGRPRFATNRPITIGVQGRVYF